MNLNLQVLIGGKPFDATLDANPATAKFLQMLPLTLVMPDLNANEKHVRLPERLPTDLIKPGTIHAGDLLRLRESLHREARDIVNAPALIDSLLANPYTTLARASVAIGRTQATAGVLIQALVRKGWLHEVTGRARRRIYLMPRILKAIERLPPMA